MKASTDSTASGFPEWLGAYRREQWLGRGGMGVVYCYRDTKLDRLVAVKALPAEFADDEARRDRLVREARSLAALDHPGIARIHHLLEHEGVDYLVLEYVAGETLSASIDRGPLPLDESLAIGLGIARAVEAGHAGGIIHCDVKPANVKLTGRGDVKLLDYGIARAVRWRGNDDTTASGMMFDRVEQEPIAGTPGYMSPEQIRGGPVDGRSDMWAIGCVLYECLTACRAFPGETAAARIRATLEDEPDWTNMPESCPPGVVAMIRALLTRDSAERPGTIAASAASVLKGEDPTIAIAGDAAVPTNVVRPLTRFVPRRGEMRQLGRLLEGSRLLTLVGPGGVGKSRLATELAMERAGVADGRSARGRSDGAWIVQLAPLSDAALIPKTIAAAVCHGEDGHAFADESAVETLVARVRDSGALIILDNCEHLAIGCASVVTRLLQACARLRIVATSRVPLGVYGEQTFRLNGLTFPEVAGEAAVSEHESVDLFVDRAVRARHDFTITPANASAVGEICRRLEGIPLAIELAAASMRALDVTEVARRLLQVIDPERILESTIESSLRQLSEPQRRLLGRLSVFRGGWSLEAAEQVCHDCSGEQLDGAPVLRLLTTLVERSLVQYEQHEDRARYHLLEPVRAYGEGHLVPEAQVPALGANHFGFFRELAAEAEPQLAGVTSGSDQKAWLERLELEHDNLRAALDLARRGGVDPDSEMALGRSLHRFWYVRGHFTEGRAALRAAIRRRGDVMDVLQLQALNAMGILSEGLGDTETARSSYQEALALARALGDRRRIAGRLTNLGMLDEAAGDLSSARGHHEQALAQYRELGDVDGTAWVQLNLAAVELRDGRCDETRRLCSNSLEVFRVGGDLVREASALQLLALAARRQGKFEEAMSLFRACLAVRKRLEDKRFTAGTLLWLGVTLADLGRDEDAVRLLAASEALREATRTVIPRADVQAYEETCRNLREKLAEPFFAAAWSAGRRMSFDQTMTDAIST